MTAVAERILSDFNSLSPEEKLLVRERLLTATEREQRDAIMRLRGAGKGEHLLARLLKDRAEERTRA